MPASFMVSSMHLDVREFPRKMVLGSLGRQKHSGKVRDLFPSLLCRKRDSWLLVEHRPIHQPAELPAPPNTPKMAAGHSLRPVHLRVGNGAQERHDFSVVQEKPDQRYGGLLFLPAHLSQDVRRGGRDGLGERERSVRLAGGSRTSTAGQPQWDSTDRQLAHRAGCMSCNTKQA